MVALTTVDPTSPMLKIALSTARSQYEFYNNTAEESEMEDVKALLIHLAESESRMIDKIQHMMVTGIVDELEELNASDDTVPDPTPFDPSRAQTDPRIYVCNQVLEKGIKTYTLYLKLATRASSSVISQLFEYLAQLKKRQIDELREICRCY
jgi:rubrerythrin